jgi:hypothetical protein
MTVYLNLTMGGLELPIHMDGRVKPGHGGN